MGMWRVRMACRPSQARESWTASRDGRALQDRAEPDGDDGGGGAGAGGVAEHAEQRHPPSVGQGPPGDEQHAASGDGDEHD
jgi:hypothetical protein